MNKQLILIRQGSNISVSDMAKLLDMTENDYLQYEIGGHEIDEHFIERINAILSEVKKRVASKEV